MLCHKPEHAQVLQHSAPSTVHRRFIDKNESLECQTFDTTFAEQQATDFAVLCSHTKNNANKENGPKMHTHQWIVSPI